MKRLIRLFRTSIGSKLVVAASGILLLGFLLAHAAGNLLILKGPAALNGYADWMQGQPLLWGFRLGLLALFGLHVSTAVRLARENLRIVENRYREGLSTSLELLDAQTGLTMAQTRVVSARRDLMLGSAALDLAVGR